MAVKRMCKDCGRSILAFSTLQNRCYDCSKKTYKPIKKRGKETNDYEVWRTTIAIPYLDARYGRICALCKGERCGNKNLDVEHKKTRGAHHNLKFDVKNVQYVGRYPCHVEKTGIPQWTKRTN